MERPMKKTGKRVFLFGALLGGCVGACAGLLLAPRSGKSTRMLLKEKGNDLKSNFKKRAKSD